MAWALSHARNFSDCVTARARGQSSLAREMCCSGECSCLQAAAKVAARFCFGAKCLGLMICRHRLRFAQSARVFGGLVVVGAVVSSVLRQVVVLLKDRSCFCRPCLTAPCKCNGTGVGLRSSCPNTLCVWPLEVYGASS